VRRLLLPLWLLLVAACGLLAVDVSESAAPPAKVSLPDIAVLDALVVNSLEIADEPDPLVRAKGSALVAQALTDAVQRSALRGDAGQAAKLKIWLAKVLEHGVRYNVDAVDPAGLAGPRLKLWNDLNHRPDVITKVLDTRLQGLNAPTKQALAEADKKEKERDKGKEFKGFGGWPKDKKGGNEKGKGFDFFKGWDKGRPDNFKGWDKGKKKKDQVSLPPMHFKMMPRPAAGMPPWPTPEKGLPPRSRPPTAGRAGRRERS
jgi:hypothetical protein